MALPADSPDSIVPRHFVAPQTERGQWRVVQLDAAGQPLANAPAVTLCSDSLMSSTRLAQMRREAGCSIRLLEDSRDSAAWDASCPRGASRISYLRDGDSVLVTTGVGGAGAREETRMRFTPLGACRAGQRQASLDEDLCRALKRDAPNIDPGRDCARAAEPQVCRQRLREGVAKMLAMCD